MFDDIRLATTDEENMVVGYDQGGHDDHPNSDRIDVVDNAGNEAEDSLEP